MKSKNKKSPLKIAVIGSGAWGINHVRTWKKIGALGVVCDANESRLSEIRKQFPGVETCADFDKVLERKDIRGVAVAVPAPLHAEIVLKALRAGKDVLVEKPMALTSEEGYKMQEAARKQGRILMVGHVLEFHPAVVKLKSMMSAGELGKIHYLYSHRLNFGRIRTEENALWSFAPHDIALFLRFTGDFPDSVSCLGSGSLSPGVADNTVTTMNFPNGLQAHIFVSWLHPFKVHRLVLVGDRQMAVFDDTQDWGKKLMLYPHRVDWIDGKIPVARKAEGVPVPLKEAEPLTLECEHFLKCIETRKEPLADSESGIRVLRVLEAAQKSMQESGKPAFFRRNEDRKSREFFAHPTAIIDPGAQIGKGSKIWHFAHVMAGKIGENTIIGQNCFIGPKAVIGNHVKIQNNVSVYQGVELEDYVFCGPAMTFTNVMNPRSEIERKTEFRRTLVKRGATLGAHSTIVCGVTVGRYAFVAAGAVVRQDVPDYALMAGVPAVQKGWMSRHGHRLSKPDKKGVMKCPESGWKYKEVKPGVLKCLDYSEEKELR